MHGDARHCVHENSQQGSRGGASGTTLREGRLLSCLMFATIGFGWPGVYYPLRLQTVGVVHGIIGYEKSFGNDEDKEKGCPHV